MPQQYQVLARKYRPKNFHELVGQTHVSKALINAIDHNRLHHAYLFTGTRGVGKTTIARILSKCLNCETGITSTPCGVCSSCTAIDQGRFIDLIEIDAASRTKVEDTRELIDNVPYAPTQGRYKVYLIDEVHMLSTHSFNALLKTLEEPPEHVKFLLATTDPQKLPITIISRCLQFVLRPLPQQAISEHLANLLTQEGVSYTQPALWQLANAAKGSVRDALSLTDQAIAFGQGQLTDDTVNEMLGLIDSADLVRLVLDIYQGDTPAVAAHIEQMRAQMVDAGSMFDGLAELLHQIAMVQLLPNVSLNVNEIQAQQITQLAQHITPDVLQLYYQIVVQGREQIKLANTPLQALEMCVLRLLAFKPLATNEVAPNQIEGGASERASEIRVAQDVEYDAGISQEAMSQSAISQEYIATQQEAVQQEAVQQEADYQQTDSIYSVADTLDVNHDATTNGIQSSDIITVSNQAEVNNQPQPNDLTEKKEADPIVYSATSDSGAQQIQVDDPRQLLKSPAVALEGEWSAEKWDYWLQTARESGALAQDQLALARQGVMTGDIHGRSEFKVAFDTKNMQSIFRHLAQHLTEQFGAEVSIAFDAKLNSEDADLLPHNRQKAREFKAVECAKEKIVSGAVMQRLMHDFQGKIVQLKLLGDK
ncbi:DNA polymerase III subunit gamma/tau [Psychrobacter lutiphocae]|uniref:DNA polymerase III subunit gamma/tau n=1 Tax=Psychrobacter lutiphocae TaxID=540500 RepID=UPI000371C336|nr:DNA polymerase III subunit gamma/tau [Psychrobacter lutiphocae]